VQAKLDNGVRSLDQTNLPRNNMVSLNDKRLVRLPAGAEEVTITRNLLADSKIISTSYNVAGYSGTTYNNANVNVGVNSIIKFKAQEDNRGVLITSDIEPSYYNGGENGVGYFIPTTDRRLHIRNADGSMTVDSVAHWMPGDSSWFGGGVFTAVANNFASPIYVWALPTGALNPTYSQDYSSVDLSFQSHTYTNGYTANPTIATKGINVGGDLSATSLGAFSTFKVTATDIDGVAGTNTYTVLWHKPLERMLHSPWVSATEGYNHDHQASDWTNLNNPITVTVKPAHVGWSIAGGGLALLAGATSLFFSGGTSVYVGLALSAAGLTFTAADPGPEEFTPTFDYDMYADAIRKQYNKNQGVPGTENDQDSVFPDYIANEAYQTLTSSGNAANDPYFMEEGLQGKIVIARKWKQQPWFGEKYDKHGYVGLDHYDITKEDFTPLYVHQVKKP
jgi:hypothetical protein